MREKRVGEIGIQTNRHTDRKKQKRKEICLNKMERADMTQKRKDLNRKKE
jgi:hypothetical protein